MAFDNARNVIMVSDNTGANNRHRYEIAASEAVLPGDVLLEGAAAIGLATDETEATAIADVKVYAAPVSGVAMDEQEFAADDLVRYFIPLPGDVVRVATGATAFTAGEYVGVAAGKGVVALGIATAFGLCLEDAASGDSHVLTRVL